MTDDSAEILFQSFLQVAIVSSSGMDRICSLFDVVHPAFPLPTKASPALQGALEDGFGEAAVACDMPISSIDYQPRPLTPLQQLGRPKPRKLTYINSDAHFRRSPVIE